MPRGVYARAGHQRRGRKRKHPLPTIITGSKEATLKPKRTKISISNEQDPIASTPPTIFPNTLPKKMEYLDDLMCHEILEEPEKIKIKESCEHTKLPKPKLIVSYERQTSPTQKISYSKPHQPNANQFSIDEICENITQAFQSIVGNQQQVIPTTELEQWCIDCNVPSFDRLPKPWCANVCILFDQKDTEESVEIYIAAWCQKTRRCLCIDTEKRIFCVNADELFRSDCEIDKEFIPNTRQITVFTIDDWNDWIFPFQLPVQSVSSLLK